MAVNYESGTALGTDFLGTDIPGGGSALLASILGAGDIAIATAAVNSDTGKLEFDANAAKAELFGIKEGTLTTADLASIPNAKVIQLNGDASANVEFGTTSSVQSILIGNSSNNKIVFQNDNTDVLVSIGGGKDNSITTAGGDDIINFGGGAEGAGASASIDTGEGNDVVNLGGYGTVDVAAGAGNLMVNMMTDGVVATVNAGDGIDMMTMVGKGTGAENIGIKANHTFEFVNGQFVMHSDSAVTLQDLELVFWNSNGQAMGNVDLEADPWSLATGATGALGASTFLADSTNLGLVGKLYAVALGRSVLDGRDNIQPVDHNAFTGIEFWTDYVDANPAISGQTLAYQFLNTAEFHNKTDGLSNADYLNWLFSNLQKDTATIIKGADGIEHSYQDYLDQLNAAGEGFTNARMDVAYNIAGGESSVEILGSDGLKYVITPEDDGGNA